jgi:hypothetical protein
MMIAQSAKQFLPTCPEKKPGPIEANDCHALIAITVTPNARNGRYRAYIKAEEEPLCASRQPFLDSARKLLARGHDPQMMLIMGWAGEKDWALRSSLGVAAKLTVDEHNGTFANWKAYSRSAVPPRNANSARKVLARGRMPKKQCLRAPPRKDSEPSSRVERSER